MRSLKVLDVTLRDGGCVNNFNFGQTYMDKILFAAENAEVDIIELGYIDQNNGSSKDRTQYLNDSVICDNFLKKKKKGCTYVAMIDYGKFDIDLLKERSSEGIDGIRLAFHKKNCKDAINLGRKIIDKGYALFIQPMITLRYSDAELLELIKSVNEELSDASGFYIVDSFGEMRPNDMNRILNLVDHNLVEKMPIGFHSHNNLQMSYSNAISMLTFPTNRDFIIDSSIMGMGKGAGNLNTELLLEHLNLYYGKNYKIAPLLDVIDKVINQLHSEFYWGYAPEYYLSATYHCSPTYANYFYSKHMLPIDQVGELLNLIADNKKISFDRDYAEEVYRTYNERKEVDDSKVVEELTKEVKGKKALLIAPGKSIESAYSEIFNLSKDDSFIVFGLNLDNDLPLKYIVTTRTDVYEGALLKGKNIIVPSNISKGGRGNVKVINYASWIIADEKTHDSSAVIVFNLLKKCGISEIMLAGFDGFSNDINENYMDLNLRHPITAKQATENNRFLKEYIKKLKKSGIKIRFITSSQYE